MLIPECCRGPWPSPTATTAPPRPGLRDVGVGLSHDLPGVVDGDGGASANSAHVLEHRRFPRRRSQHRVLAARGLRISNAPPGVVDGVGAAVAPPTSWSTVAFPDGDHSTASAPCAVREDPTLHPASGAAGALATDVLEHRRFPGRRPQHRVGAARGLGISDAPPGIVDCVGKVEGEVLDLLVQRRRHKAAGRCHENGIWPRQFGSPSSGSGRGDGSPSPERFFSEGAERAAGAEMALDVEGVVNGGVNRQEALC
jgi:hypothetical protein